MKHIRRGFYVARFEFNAIIGYLDYMALAYHVCDPAERLD
jgi:hypothetical protein